MNDAGSRILSTTGKTIDVSAVGSGLSLVSHSHNLVHEGKMFFTFDAATVVDGSTREFWFSTPDSMTEIHWVLGGDVFPVNFSASAVLALLDLYEGTSKTYVSGNALTVYNRNRNSHNSSSMQVCHTPGGSGDGTLICASSGRYGTHYGSLGINPWGRRDGGELILKRNTAYLLRVTAEKWAGPASNLEITTVLSWYEHRTDTYTTTTTSP